MYILEYLSLEDGEYLNIDKVSAKELSIEQLVDVYKQCIESIYTRNKDDLYEFITTVLEVLGDTEYSHHCDQCGDDVYDHILKTKHYNVVYTEGCTCYGITVNNHDYFDYHVTSGGVVEFLDEVQTLFGGNKDALIDILMNFVRIFGTFDEKWCDENNNCDTYNERYVYKTILN